MIRDVLKKLVKKIPFAFTKNQRYDKWTGSVILSVCKAESNCIDIGCHKGEIMDKIRKVAYLGTHYGFEPIPGLYEKLLKKYRGTNVRIYPLALSDQKGTAYFNYVLTNPAYSGLRKRSYDRPNEKDLLITVDTDRLDNIIPPDCHIQFIKIDVEGGELQVMRGAKELLKRCKPVVVFEHGLGGSEVYGSTPELVFDLLAECGLSVNLLDRWLKRLPPLSLEQFKQQYDQRLNYYFIADREIAKDAYISNQLLT